MELLDTKHVDIIVEGKIVKIKLEAGLVNGVIEIPLIEILKQLAAKTDNKIDDAIVELVEKALA